MIKKLSQMAIFSQELTANKKVIVDFYATWCGPCNKISPTYEKFAKEYSASNIQFCKVDVDENEEVCMKYNVTSMPTFIAFANGKEFKRILGANEIALKAFIEELKKEEVR